MTTTRDTGRIGLVAAVAIALLIGACGGKGSTKLPSGSAHGDHPVPDPWQAVQLPEKGVSFALPGELLEAQSSRPILETTEDGVVRIDWESPDLFQNTGGYCLAIVCTPEAGAPPGGDVSKSELPAGIAKQADAAQYKAGAGIELRSARLSPARVSELDDQGAFPGLFTLEVPAAVARGIRLGTDRLIVFAPEDAKADEIRAVPPLVRFDEASLKEYFAVQRRQRQLAESYRDQSRFVSISMNNIKQIGLALANYYSAMDHLPPAVIYGPDGKPWHSWRVLILPYLEQAPLYNAYRFDEPWNGPNNSKLLDKMPDVYRQPGDTSHFTHYVVPVGRDVAFPAEGATMPADKGALKSTELYVSNGKGYRSLAAVTDGTSNTIAVGTISPGRKIEWMKPEDLPIRIETGKGPPSASPALGAEDGFATPYKSDDGPFGIFLLVDASVKRIHQSVSPSTFAALLTFAGGEVVSADAFGGGKTTLGTERLSSSFRLEVSRKGDSHTARLREVSQPQPVAQPGSVPPPASGTPSPK